MPPLGAESSDNLYLLAKRMALERQRSLSNSYPIPNPNVLSSIADNPRQQQLHSQNTDFMSILQGLSDRSASGVNNGVSGGWSNFPAQGGLDPHGQNFPPPAAFGIQQPRLQPPSQPSLTTLLAQGVDNLSGSLTPEMLLSSGLSQDPQLLSLLQQQYLLQLHSQAPPVPPPQQLSVLDKLLLLKQQQKQEEQQQLIRQQQQLLSQVLSEQHSHQRLGQDPSYGQSQSAGLPVGNAHMDHTRFQIGSQIQPPNMQDDHAVNFLSLPLGVSKDTRNVVSPAASIDLPHQMFGNAMSQKSWGATNHPEQIDDIPPKGSLSTSSEMVDKYTQEQALQENLRSNEPITVATTEALNYAVAEHLEKPVVPFEGIVENEVVIPEQVNNLKVPTADVVEEPQLARAQINNEPSSLKEVKTVEVKEVKKAAEKKSKKQKSSKAQSSEQAKVVSKTQQSKQSETEATNIVDAKSLNEPSMQEKRERKSGLVTDEILEPPQSKNTMPIHISSDDGETAEPKSEPGQVGPVAQVKTQVNSGQRAWKPAPGLKPKSLLEIQQEEQRKAQAQVQAQAQAAAEMSVSEISAALRSTSFSSPWVGATANSDHKSTRETQPDAVSTKLHSNEPDGSLNRVSKKSQLHDLLAEEASAKSNEREFEVPYSNQSDPIEDDNFVEAKDTKKSRKKSAKAKSGGTKVQVPIPSVELSVGSSPIQKGKSSRPVQPEKDILPAVPSGPSLGDFVVWKGEAASPSPAPAWSTDSGKPSKTTSLRDILKEQGKKGSTGQYQNSVQIPQKSVPAQQPTRGGGPSWSVSGSSPVKAASPVKMISQSSSQSKQKVDDDFFWGPLDQPKQEAKQYVPLSLSLALLFLLLCVLFDAF